MIEKVKTFRHGIHPAEFKDYTKNLPIERIPFTNEYVLPLSQHLGGPSRAVVKPGDKVYRGQLIAEASGFVSATLHASVTGKVKAIESRNHPSGNLVKSIIIERDPYSPQTLHNERKIDWEKISPKEALREIQMGGFVGLGGAAFPTHVKLAVPPGKKARFFIINAAECEPYLTTDHRMMLEQADSMLLGIRISMKILGAEKAYIGIETNKPDAIEYLRQVIPSDMACEVAPVQTKYPQGAEKMLITAILKRDVPSGKLPIDAEVVVHNVGTLVGIGDLFKHGKPLIERVVTITGPGIHRPANLMIPLGMKLNQVLDYCGGLKENTRQLLFGGPMMGAPQSFLDVPIMKGTSGIVALTDKEVFPRKERACIRCSRCIDACPVFLNPSRLGSFARVKRYEEMMDFHLMDCIECASCSYVCPSSIPLVQRFRVAKGMLREKQARERAGKKS
ncbi:MAG: electron transport complex subunit RsxC [Candidatus Cloacimonetes bacterium 4572_55]|nr:MAG: electron transport complex subunit RsxC [Candidatus Cloacimonetes bacterium 4572_55]